MKKIDEQLSIIGMMTIILSPWIYHLVYCFKNHEYILLVAGVVFFPVGWIHGLGAFLNWW